MACCSNIFAGDVIRKASTISVGNSDVISCVDGLESWPVETKTRSWGERLLSVLCPRSLHVFLSCPGNIVGAENVV